MAQWKRPTKEELRRLRHEVSRRARHGKLRLPNAVAEIRKSVGMTQQQFAEALGMTRRQIAELELGKSNPTLQTLEKIAGQFGFAVGIVPKAPIREPGFLPSEHEQICERVLIEA